MHGRVRDNVRHIRGGDDEAVARAQWRNYVRYMRDFAALEHEAPAATEQIFAAAEGWQHIVDAMAEGKGLIVCSAHFGNWDLAGAAMAQHYPVNVIADTFRSASMDRLINRRRELLRLKVIPVEKAVKRTVSALKRGEGVAFLIDKPVVGDEGVEVEFFGAPVRIPAGAGFFAARVGAPIVPAFVWRKPDRTFAGRVLPALRAASKEDVQPLMQRVMASVEDMVREHPESWYMFRSMWLPETSSEKLAVHERPPATHRSLPVARKEEALA